MYEPYVHATARNLMLTLPPWRIRRRCATTGRQGRGIGLIQARGLACWGRRLALRRGDGVRLRIISRMAGVMFTTDTERLQTTGSLTDAHQTFTAKIEISDSDFR